ncbi:MAG: hypothetical protein PHN38_07600 [Sulfurospirillaceae bacterium]|nr:hypothetical protein [Sulfurospirillaceae bacterium]
MYSLLNQFKTNLKSNLSPFAFVVVFALFFTTLAFGKGSSLSHQNPFVSALPSGNSLNLYGDFIATGNSVLCENNGGACNNNYTGYLYDSNLIYKNEAASIALNSASATLTLPSGVSSNEIIWAGLYWQGHIAGTNAANYGTSTMIANRNQINAIWPDGNSSAITADTVWYHDFWGDGTGNGGGYRSFYQGFKNVTTLLKSHLVAGVSQSVTVGNIKANNGADWYSYFYLGPGAEYNGLKIGFWGNWSLVVVYKYPDNNIPVTAKLKNIQVNHGFDAMFPLPIAGYEIFNVTVPITNFLTPNSNSVNSQMLFYASGGEKKIERDAFYIQNANNSYTYTAVSNGLNPVNNPFNGTVSDKGVALNGAITYYPGMDLDIYDVSSYMTNRQTTTSIKLEATFSNSNGDQSTPGVIAFSTELYDPKFCYDYAYSQNGRYFTADNNGSSQPRITGTITPTDDINVTLYIRNEEDSDVQAQNLILNIKDINTSQAIYKRNSVYLTHPNEVIPVHVPDTSLSVSDSYISNISHGNIYGKEYFYTYYALTPQSIGNIDMVLDANISYTLVLSTGGSLPYTHNIGSTKLPMCSGDNKKYEPEWGIFNVSAKGIYNSSDTYPKFNIPTQVVRRPGEFWITAHDANSTPVPYIREMNISTVVGVELIDAGKFHSTKASCDEPSSAISEKFWVPFMDASGAKSQVDFETALQTAITEGSISIKNKKDYFDEARQNTAFRIQVNVGNDGNDSIIQYQKLANGKYKMLNFTNLIQDYGTCKQPVRMFPYGHNNNGTTMQVAVACGNAGTTGVDFFTLSTCHECILGYSTINICSRDNFATRPESFNIKLTDQNQTDKTKQSRFADDRTGVITPNTAKVNIASGYDYRFDINATNHDDNNKTSGYTAFFSPILTNDRNISFNWSPPLTIINPTATCNDLTSKALLFSMINGTVSGEANISNVGEYMLGMIDKEWNVVDYDPARMTHHKSAFINGSYTNVTNYFVGSGNALDCLSNSSIVQQTATLPSISGANLANINGCIITSNNHNNLDSNLKYRDYNVTVHPYKFMNLVTPSFGVAQNINFNNGWLYMNDINNSADINHSMHFRGDIFAAGFNNVATTNFVTNCFAKDINISLDHNFSRTPEIAYQYRLFDRNASNDIIDTIPPTLNNPGDINTSIVIPQADFTKTMNGATRIDLNINFDRNISTMINPIIVSYNDLNSTCSNKTADCTMQADLKNNHTTEGNLTMIDANLTHYYGRVHAPDYRFQGNEGTATVYYEVYCRNCSTNTPLNFTGAQESIDSIYWYRNTLHTLLNEGSVQTFNSRALVEFGAGGGANTSTTAVITTGSESQIVHAPTLPYVDRIEMTPSAQYLLFNQFNPLATTNDFTVEFIQSGNWAGQGKLGQTIDDTNTSVSKRSNRRLEW